MPNSSTGTKESRVAARREWPVRKYRLGAEPSADLSGATTPQQRVEMMWTLALEAWSLTGTPLPDYSRRSTPSRRVRRDNS